MNTDVVIGMILACIIGAIGWCLAWIVQRLGDLI